ncbi:MAG: zinc-dependent alcohol dehydrogenase family protein [Methylococcales bacterium]
MKAVLMNKVGSTNNLQLSTIDEPEITHPTEVKINIKAAGVNPIDCKIRNNGSFYQHPLPIVLGCDGAGEIISVGEAVTQYKVADEVWFCHGGLGQEQGSYAEYTVIDSRWIALKPKTISFAEAAAMPLVLITAWGALFDKGNLQANETVLIHAGAGGVGHIAIQLAKLKGAIVITTVSSKEKADFCLSLGADHVIIYTQDKVLDEVNRLTSGRGVELVIDTVGTDVFKLSIFCAAYFGRIITLLDPGELSLAEARMKNLLIGFELMLSPLLKQLDSARDHQVKILNQCAQWIDQGKLKVKISETLPLEQAPMAHSKIEQGHTTGKIVLTM